jgi:hypothetical protein
VADNRVLVTLGAAEYWVVAITGGLATAEAGDDPGGAGGLLEGVVKVWSAPVLEPPALAASIRKW